MISCKGLDHNPYNRQKHTGDSSFWQSHDRNVLCLSASDRGDVDYLVKQERTKQIPPFCAIVFPLDLPYFFQFCYITWQ
jgi:hypothetical protein